MRAIAICFLLFAAAACNKVEPRRYVVQGSQPESCIECHQRINPGVVADHLAGPHQSIPLECEGCHGVDHDEIYADKGAVSPLVCAECHPTEYEEMGRSRHGVPLKGG